MFRHQKSRLASMLLLGALLSSSALANEVIVGKSGWLYYTYDTTESLDIGVSLNLIRGVERALARNGTRLVVLVTPMKARIYPEYLPAGFKIPQSVSARYSRTINFMRANKILAPDLSAAFRSSPRRVADIPLYFRQDTHWSARGGTEAARTVASYLESSPSLLKGIPSVKTSLIETKPEPFQGDLYKLLIQQGKTVPVADKHYGLELTRPTASTDLLGDETPGIALVGSSYSAQWLGFPNALRSALKKDVFDLSVPADRGQWHGLETYLQDDAFQTSRPRILIWEMPERDLTSYPDAKWKQPRYQSNNTEWLVRSAALIEKGCGASGITATISSAGLGKGSKSANVNTASTGPNDYVEYRFSRPVQSLDYLSASLKTTGSAQVTVQALGPGISRKLSVPMANSTGLRPVKVALHSASAKPFTVVRIYPGKTSGFALQNLKVCRLPKSVLNP